MNRINNFLKYPLDCEELKVGAINGNYGKPWEGYQKEEDREEWNDTGTDEKKKVQVKTVLLNSKCEDPTHNMSTGITVNVHDRLKQRKFMGCPNHSHQEWLWSQLIWRHPGGWFWI